MAFTEIVTLNSQPGKVVALTNQVSVDTNFCIVNNDLNEFDVEVWGHLLFAIYAPSPLNEYGVFLSVPCYNRAHLIFHPVTVLSGLNILVRFYAEQHAKPRSITLWGE